MVSRGSACPSRVWMIGRSAPAVEQVGGETVAESVRMDVLGNAGAPGGLAAGVPDGFCVIGWSARRVCSAGEQPAVSNASPSGSRSASCSSSFGLSGTSRSLPPLPWRTWMTMRSLSMSRAGDGITRRGACQSNRASSESCDGAGCGAASISLATSSGLSTIGICRRSNFGSGRSSGGKALCRTLQKKKRSAAVCSTDGLRVQLALWNR